MDILEAQEAFKRFKITSAGIYRRNGYSEDGLTESKESGKLQILL